MKFEEMKTNFLDMEYDDRIAFIMQYRDKRQSAIQQTLVKIKPASNKASSPSKKGKTISVNKEQLELLKSLGLI